VPVLRDELREPLRAQRDPLAEDSGRPRANREDRRRWRKQSWLGRFISTYGWRAYALPALVALTVWVVYSTVTGTSVSNTDEDAGPAQGPPTIGADSTAIIGAPPKGLTQFDASLPTGMLPDGGPYTEAGAKTWHIVPGADPKVGEGTTKTFTYTVEVEDGIDTTSFGGDDNFARMVSQTLANPKSWTHNPQFAFTRIDSGDPDFRVSLTTPMTLREGCGYEIPIETSCFNPSFASDSQPRVLINESRWVRGAVPFQGDVGAYRQYLVNHEVGHAIGYQRHEPCAENGQLAPVMMQQTFSTSDNDNSRFDPEWVKADGKTCKPNPWPYPIP
jgi:ABC-type sugar transport system permease subunit